MKFILSLSPFIAGIGVLWTGCMSMHTVLPQHLVLASNATNELPLLSHKPLSIGVGFVKMPAYLQRNSVAIRESANEIEYTENALWAERLDQCFQETLAADISRL